MKRRRSSGGQVSQGQGRMVAGRHGGVTTGLGAQGTPTACSPSGRRAPRNRRALVPEPNREFVKLVKRLLSALALNCRQRALRVDWPWP